jgi:hypothetical protein
MRASCPVHLDVGSEKWLQDLDFLTLNMKYRNIAPSKYRETTARGQQFLVIFKVHFLILVLVLEAEKMKTLFSFKPSIFHPKLRHSSYLLSPKYLLR